MIDRWGGNAPGRSPRRGPRRCLAALLLAVLAAGAVSGCVFRDVARQQARFEALCTLSGTVESETADDRPLVVLLVRTEGSTFSVETVRLVDHFVREGGGRWLFRASAGTYGFAAFEDTNRTLIYNPDEPFLRLDFDALVDCRPGDRFEDIRLVVPASGRPRFDGPLDVGAMQARSPEDQLELSIGMVTAAGDVTDLDDQRFDETIGRSGMWRPFDFLFDGRPGVYFLQDWDPDKVPVLFVHGANGTPRNFRTLVAALDRTKFQPWVYYYPSGAGLQTIAEHLDQTLLQLRRRFGFDTLAVVAHSMGGLIARAFVLEHDESRGADVPVLITIATPWDGHAAARIGVDRAPAVVRSWFDMAPGSPFLTDLFHRDGDDGRERRALPDDVAHHLLFAYRRNSLSFGVSDDQVATVASQLRSEAQQDAAQVRGFDETHTGVLAAPDVVSTIDAILAAAVR